MTVFMADVADVRMGHAVRQGAAPEDGRGDTVGGIGLMLRGENSRDVVRRVEKKVAEINGSNVWPAGVGITPFDWRTLLVMPALYEWFDRGVSGARRK
jgi:cobalt-zinc-cadmium resistance protein CzcA